MKRPVDDTWLKVDAPLKDRLAARARDRNRTLEEQLRRYLEFAMLAEDNPQLPTEFINGIVENLTDIEAIC